MTNEPTVGNLEPAVPEADAAGTETPSIEEKRQSRADRRRSRHNHRHAWSQRSKLLLGILVLVLLIDFFGGVRMYVLDRENAALRSHASQIKQELERLKPEVQQLRQERDHLLQQRLPGLDRLEFDQVISLNNGYLKNITFTRVKDSKFSGYEYKLVLENNSVVKVWPQLTIYFFNDSGIQTGASEVGGQDSTAALGSLEPNEVRSYSATLAVQEGEKIPAYFLIKRKQEDLEGALLDKDKTP